MYEVLLLKSYTVDFIMFIRPEGDLVWYYVVSHILFQSTDIFIAPFSSLFTVQEVGSRQDSVSEIQVALLSSRCQ